MKTIKILLVCVMVTGLYTTSVAFSKEKTDEIKSLVENMQEQGIALSSWKVYILKSVQDVASEKEALEELEDIKKTEQGYRWELQFEGNKSFIAEGYKKVDSMDIELKVKVTGNRLGNMYRMYYAYEINSQWNNESLEYVVSKYQYLINNQKAFFTFKGSLLQNHKLNQQAEDILSGLNGTFIEGVAEENFISMSAYSKKLDQNSISINGQKINLQIGLRHDIENEQVEVTIGTPMITDGY
ncbi:hypothetical protein GCM10008967_11430 [Bacillus carboniphilus]|uniref:TATA-box binding protein n=1 Tax=Bacillus carboniphilus TaxID=86663 RepID=A0ABN0W1E1_9BACI